MADTSWVSEGATVAELSSGGTDYHVSFTTVERLTATQIVCASGRRYRRDNGALVGGGRRELRPVDDQHIRDVVAGRQVQRLRYRLDSIRKDARGGEVEMLAILDQLERAIAEVRAVITDPTRS